MCVIMLASKVRPTEEMVRRGWSSNKDGAGIAWREKDEVVWEKGIMDLERAVEICAKTPLPYVVHFRVASIGGVRPSLTHPFLVGPDASTALKGRTRGAVLFHNGHWNAWNDKMLDAAIHSDKRLPEGNDWSDSRAMAWLVHLYGPTVMEILTAQKGILMGPRKLNLFTGNGWEKINDVWCSNDYFWLGRHHSHGSHQSYGRLCRTGKCHEKAAAGKDYCDKCEEERKATAEKIVAEANGPKKEVGATSTVASRTEGVGPLAKMYSMAEVETFYKNKLVSKTTLKKYRKAHGTSLLPGNKAQRGLTQMKDLSQTIAEYLMTAAGSVN